MRHTGAYAAARVEQFRCDRAIADVENLVIAVTDFVPIGGTGGRLTIKERWAAQHHHRVSSAGRVVIRRYREVTEFVLEKAGHIP